MVLVERHSLLEKGPLFLVLGLHVLAVPSHDGRDPRSLWGLFYKNTNPIHDPNATTLAFGFQEMDLRTRRHADIAGVNYLVPVPHVENDKAGFEPRQSSCRVCALNHQFFW